MTRKELHEKLSDIITQLDNNNNRLYLHSEGIERLDVDLMRKLAIDCYDSINRLALVIREPIAETQREETNEAPEIRLGQSKQNDNEKISTPVPEVETSEPEPTEEPPSIEVEDPSPSVEIDLTPEEDEVYVDKEEKEVIEKEIKEELKTESTEKKSKPQEADQGSVVDKLQSDQDSIVDRMANKKVDDIKKAISISKRFEIQSNLFDNDRVMYEKTMEYFNSADSLNSGMERFKEMVSAHGWDIESRLVQEVEQLIQRRYA